jgi:uncharacterized protein YfaS (alpha-2-macroglobulin family)
MSTSMFSRRPLAVAVMILAGSLVAAAQTAPLTLSLSVNPSSVAPGGTVIVTGSITNNLTKPQTAAIQVDVTGPCGYADTYSYKLALKAGETVTDSRTYVAPACAGDYTLVANAASKAGAATQVWTTFTVVQQ